MLPALAPGSIPMVYVPVIDSVIELINVVPLVQLDDVSWTPPGAYRYSVQPAKVEPLNCKLTPWPATPSNKSKPIWFAAREMVWLPPVDILPVNPTSATTCVPNGT